MGENSLWYLTGDHNNDQMPVTCNCAAVRAGGEFLCFHAITETSMELHCLYEYVEKIIWMSCILCTTSGR